MDGNRCLVGARQRVQGLLGIEGEDAAHYLRLAIAPFARFGHEPADIHLMSFNDRSATYDEVRALIVTARDPSPKPTLTGSTIGGEAARDQAPIDCHSARSRIDNRRRPHRLSPGTNRRRC